jgi:hypothetical protein
MTSRKDFWAHNASTVDLALSQASELDGMVAILADVRDEVGGGLIRTLAEVRGQDIEPEIAKLATQGIPTGLALLPARIVAEVLRENNPQIAHVLLTLTPPEDAIYVVVIADGGSMLLLTPRPNRNEVIGQA